MVRHLWEQYKYLIWDRHIYQFLLGAAQGVRESPFLSDQQQSFTVSNQDSTTGMIMMLTADAIHNKEVAQVMHQSCAVKDNWLVLGRDAIGYIASMLPLEDAGRLASSCRFLHEKIQPTLELRRLRALGHFVIVEPNENRVKHLLADKPELVNAIIPPITDAAGRVHREKTILQLSYSVKDAEMCEVIKLSFISHYQSETTGLAAMQTQINEAFGYETADYLVEATTECAVKMKLLMQPVITAIEAELFNLGRNADKKLVLNPATLLAIEVFRDELKRWMMKNDKRLRAYDSALQTVYDTYVMKAAQWHYDEKKCGLLEDGVLSAVFGYAPENDAQKFSQGLYYLQDHHEPFKRTIALRFCKRNFYEVLSYRSVDFDLSRRYAQIATWHEGIAPSVCLGRQRVRISNHITSKYSKMENVLQQLPQVQEPLIQTDGIFSCVML